MEIFTADQQRALLMAKGLSRLTRDDLAKEIGVSLPTMTKLINGKAPFAIQSSIYQKVGNWLESKTPVLDK
jgi:DNA-binding XRE family transcriptional regulator